ncbi:hypothetical protein niasHT_032533 [Heterodera trifolii]|uniref:BHLH domain-containing protein n=1 Tax=Heterodera trifolii TaxID=157864 RepID=A0ABD2HXB2_9BILA
MTVNGKKNTEGLNVRRRALINQLLFEMSDLCPRVDQLQADSPKLRSASVLLIKRWSECPSEISRSKLSLACDTCLRHKQGNLVPLGILMSFVPFLLLNLPIRSGGLTVMIKGQQRTDDQKDGDQSTRQWQWPLHVRTIYAQDLPFEIVTKCRLSLLSMNNRGKTELTNPDYRKDDFLIRIETMHLSDRGTTKNFRLSGTRSFEGSAERTQSGAH